MNLPKKTSMEWMDNILREWNWNTMSDISYYQAAKKWEIRTGE